MILSLAARENLPDDFPVTAVSALDKPLAELKTPTPDELMSIYRESLSTIGLWQWRGSPLLQR